MCGIAGVFHRGGLPSAGEWEAKLTAAAACFAHRGPDASGVFVDAAHGVALAHRRLAILDLDPRSNQPFRSADGTLSLVFNGEIYNFAALRAELTSAGVSFRTSSDTEVLLEGYRAWGLERLLPRLAGMFAFALHDARQNRL